MNIAAYTSKFYLPTFLSLYDSIKFDKNINLFVLCYDDEVKNFLKKKLKNVHLYQQMTLKIKIMKLLRKNIGILMKNMEFIDWPMHNTY